MAYTRFAIASVDQIRQGIFAISTYAQYKYQQVVIFKENYEQQENKKKYLMEIHQKKAAFYDKYLDKYEIQNRINKYRKVLLSYAEGNVLETGVGTSRNLIYYPYDCQITAIDWASNVLEVALLKEDYGKEIRYLLEDVEKMSFMNDQFDTIVDTFGLQYYHDPDAALNEMERVCKKNGLILLLENGKASYDYINLYLEFQIPHYVQEYGYFPSRDWESILKNHPNLEVELQERKINGRIHYYHLRNKK